MTIDLPLDDRFSVVARPRCVKAVIVDIAPRLASVATFAVCRDPYEPGLWQVTNVETGTNLATSKKPTRDESIAAGRDECATRTEADVIAAFDRLPPELREVCS